MAKKANGLTLVAQDPDDQAGELKDVGGSPSDKWNNYLARQALNTLWLKHSNPAERESQLSATLAGLVGIRPRDELEGMLAAQLLAAHNAGMECYRRAMLPDQTFQGRQEALNQASKLSRTFSALLEALNRHRGKGQQKVTVEHVHVHSGGQAIVGNVNSPGGGMKAEIKDQAHANQVTYAPQSAVRGQDPEGDKLPVSGDAERAL